MANAYYNEGTAARNKADADLDTITVDLVALDPDYVFSASHTGSDLTAHVVDTAAGLTGKTVASDGSFSTDAAVFTGIGVGDEVGSFVLRKQSGVLFAYYDLSTSGGVAIVGDGEDLTVNPPADGWFF